VAAARLLSLPAADWLAILDVITRADEAATRRDADAYVALFTPDAVLDGTQGRHVGREAPGQILREVSRLVDDQGDQDGKHQKAQDPAGHHAVHLGGSNSVTGSRPRTRTVRPVRCRTQPRCSISSARAAARPSGANR
jgi:hypothetical protein